MKFEADSTLNGRMCAIRCYGPYKTRSRDSGLECTTFKEIDTLWFSMDTVTIPRDEYDSLVRDSKILKRSNLYQKVIDFENSIAENGEFTRKDLGF
jgi:hypothetical protein